jgi:hypothetical protein
MTAPSGPTTLHYLDVDRPPGAAALIQETRLMRFLNVEWVPVSFREIHRHRRSRSLHGHPVVRPDRPGELAHCGGNISRYMNVGHGRVESSD